MPKTSTDSFPFDSDIMMRAIPVVSGFELTQVPGKAEMSIGPGLRAPGSTRSLI
jgi:hypothetical protein